MIKENDRILLALSGGKDSATMAWDLLQKKRWWPRNFELLAVHIESGLDNSWEESRAGDLYRSWGIDYNTVKAPVLERLKPGRKFSCYWCSTQRRTELIRYAQSNGCNVIALGHHMDDIVETLLMNMMDKGQLSFMLPSMQYDRYNLRLIRPLALCEKKQITNFAEWKGFSSYTCNCSYGDRSKRLQARLRLETLTGGSSAIKRRIFESQFNRSDPN